MGFLEIKRKVALKREAKGPPMNLKSTVDSCDKGRMMVNPLGTAHVPFIGFKISRSLTVVKNQDLVQP